MNTKQLITIAVGGLMAANTLVADWEDYFWITSPNSVNGFATLNPAVPVVLDGAGPGQSIRPAFGGIWTAQSVGPLGGQLVVSPANTDYPPTPGGGPATAFTLTIKGGGVSSSFLTIDPPGAGDWYNQLGYTFDWVCNFKDGSTAWYTDALGTHQILGSPSQPDSGSDLFFAVVGPNGGPWGWEIRGDQLQSLQVQGWQRVVPEPSSIAMSAVVFIGAAFAALRRYRKV